AYNDDKLGRDGRATILMAVERFGEALAAEDRLTNQLYLVTDRTLHIAVRQEALSRMKFHELDSQSASSLLEDVASFFDDELKRATVKNPYGLHLATDALERMASRFKRQLFLPEAPEFRSIERRMVQALQTTATWSIAGGITAAAVDGLNTIHERRDGRMPSGGQTLSNQALNALVELHIANRTYQIGSKAWSQSKVFLPQILSGNNQAYTDKALAEYSARIAELTSSS
ncbi:hypothetical protein OAO01_08535, partial [Oligoflexia bacterium]|nr:hypothetical protein [Oligoflexia bacterium]